MLGIATCHNQQCSHLKNKLQVAQGANLFLNHEWILNFFEKKLAMLQIRIEESVR